MFPLGQGELSTLHAKAHWHCDLYRIARIDGAPPLRVSTLDRKIIYKREVYNPTAGERYDEEFGNQFSGGNTELVGVICPDTVSQRDIQLGVFDDAKLDQFVVDWRRGKRYLHRVWYIDEVLQDGRLWRAQLSTMSRFLQQKMGNGYYFTCPAILGDARCKKVVTLSSGTVTSVADPQITFGSGVVAGTNLFALGSVTWTSGSNKGRRHRVYSFLSGSFVLAEPTRFAIKVGDTFTARPGCDGRATTCRNTHANLENFRGNERQGNAKQLILARGTIA